MPETVELSPEGLEVQPHPRVVLRTRGLTGKVAVHEARSEGTRGAEETRAALIQALEHNDLEEDLTVEIADQREEDPSQGSRAAGGSDDIELGVRDPGPGFAQFVLYESEDGVLSWHLPQQDLTADGTSRGGGAMLTYRIPRTVASVEPGEETGHRGILGAAGKKILKVVTFRLIKAGGTWAAERYAEKIETARRPHRLRTYLPGEHSAPATTDLNNDDLRAMGSGRSLLLVHGTMSTSHNAFGRLEAAHLQTLHDRYDGRVLAFDHPTVSISPAENVAWLARRLAEADVNLELDLLSHSRGGLVTRVLTERPDLAGLDNGRVRVHRSVMVATPNAGTQLADVKHIEQMLDRMTNLLQLVPDNGITDVLDVILAVLKQVAAGVAEGLGGLMSMNPRGDFLTGDLNIGTAVDTAYFAVAADFEPPKGSKLLRVARDFGTDLVFGQNPNDLVVPTQGVFELAKPGGAFPIADKLVFAGKDVVDHSGYWTKQRFIDQLLEWLPGDVT